MTDHVWFRNSAFFLDEMCFISSLQGLHRQLHGDVLLLQRERPPKTTRLQVGGPPVGKWNMDNIYMDTPAMIYLETIFV